MSNRPDNHGPVRFEHYFTTHETVMAQFRDQGFVVVDTLDFIPFGSRFFLAGEIACVGKIVIDVLKEMEWLDSFNDGESQVQTIMYAYNVSVRGQGNVFRYDNQHGGYQHLGHADSHHKHIFAWPQPTEIAGSPIHVGADAWPTLGSVIEEARGWHADNFSKLSDPTGHDPNLRRGLRL